MKQKIIMFTLVTIILFCAVLIGYQIPKQQVKMKQNQIEDLQEEQRILRDKNGELNKLVKRQSKTVISDEEKQIREVSSNFVKQMFEMKKDSSFKSKAPQIKPLVTKDYYDTLFKDSKDKYDLYDDITVNDIHVYFDTYDPKKDSYKVFVQFDERIETDGDDKIEHRQTSAQLDLVRTAEGWRIDNLKRFNLKPLKDSNTKVSRVYKINQTSDKYEEDSNIDAEKFEKDNKPVYEENNMKK
ncbi:transposon-related protein [Staphylococcus aureus]|nr:transposon-related protein [Staphylococcus aureus]